MSLEAKRTTNLNRKTFANLRWAIALAGVLAGAAPVATANDLCGATIVENLTLDHDLVCTGDGLVLGADGISINLNGHTLRRAGVGIGIAVFGGTDVEMKNGVITGFAVGVRLNTSTDVEIKNVLIAGNPEGIDLQAGSIGNTIKNSVFRNSATRAIMLRGGADQNDIKDNQFIGNRVGILVCAGVDNSVKNNLITGSTLAGIRFQVLATGNELKDNAVISNAAGIESQVMAGNGSTGNTLKANRIMTNGCGLKGPTEGNTFVANWFEGNVADACP